MEISLSVDNELKNEALAHRDERIKYEYNRFGLDIEKRKSMILIGTIGQLVFKKFLKENKVKFDFEFQAGRYDNIDFVITNKIYEIKCSGFKDSYNHMNIFYAKDQFSRGINKGYDYCVQIFINGYDKKTKLLDIDECDLAVIFGYIEFPKIKEFKNPNKRYYGDDYKVPLFHLKDLKTLLKIK